MEKTLDFNTKQRNRQIQNRKEKGDWRNEEIKEQKEEE